MQSLVLLAVDPLLSPPPRTPQEEAQSLIQIMPRPTGAAVSSAYSGWRCSAWCLGLRAFSGISVGLLGTDRWQCPRWRP
jgi:hypothetical protein